MKRFIIFISASIFCNSALGYELKEISEFAADICDKIDRKGEITKHSIQGELEGSAELLKILGIDLEGSGNISSELQEYTNLLIEDIPEQMSTARECRRYLADKLLNETFYKPVFYNKGVSIWQNVETISVLSDWSQKRYEGDFCEDKVANTIRDKGIEGLISNSKIIKPVTESGRRTEGGFEYQYSCTFQVMWNPI